ncbi:MAG: ArsR/SmtB family transcription factor [Thermomicrobiales bacterium]
MGKKTDKLIEKMRSDVQALSEAVWALKDHVRIEAAADAAANGSRRAKSRKVGDLEKQIDGSGGRGATSSYGSYAARNRSGASTKVQWQQENVATESLQPHDVELTAARLSAIGHRQRLGIVLALLEQPSSVSDLVTSLELGTTGAAYHHLNVLQNAGFVVQEERGTYEIVPEQIGAVLGILAALSTEALIEKAPEG